MSVVSVMDGRAHMPDRQGEDRGVSQTNGKTSRFLLDLNKSFNITSVLPDNLVRCMLEYVFHLSYRNGYFLHPEFTDWKSHTCTDVSPGSNSECCRSRAYWDPRYRIPLFLSLIN